MSVLTGPHVEATRRERRLRWRRLRVPPGDHGLATGKSTYPTSSEVEQGIASRSSSRSNVRPSGAARLPGLHILTSLQRAVVFVER